MPEPFYAVGQHYRDFGQVSDEEVIAILGAHPRSANIDPAHRRGGG